MSNACAFNELKDCYNLSIRSRRTFIRGIEPEPFMVFAEIRNKREKLYNKKEIFSYGYGEIEFSLRNCGDGFFFQIDLYQLKDKRIKHLINPYLKSEAILNAQLETDDLDEETVKEAIASLSEKNLKSSPYYGENPSFSKDKILEVTLEDIKKCIAELNKNTQILAFGDFISEKIPEMILPYGEFEYSAESKAEKGALLYRGEAVTSYADFCYQRIAINAIAERIRRHYKTYNCKLAIAIHRIDKEMIALELKFLSGDPSFLLQALPKWETEIDPSCYEEAFLAEQVQPVKMACSVREAYKSYLEALDLAGGKRDLLPSDPYGAEELDRKIGGEKAMKMMRVSEVNL